MNVKTHLEQIISAALVAAGAPEGSPALVAISGKPEFGDYQANGVMAVAKRLKANPRQLAQKVLDAAAPAMAEIASKVEIAGPGFINITLKAEWLAGQLSSVQTDEHLGVGQDARATAQTVVVDYSAPNLAKEMHVGHLRSTIIGDCLARVLDFVGHKVIRQNHVGDWGTQFGVVILALWHICMARRRMKEGGSYYIADELRALDSARGDEIASTKLLRQIRDRHEQDWESDKTKDRGDGERWFGPFLESWVKCSFDISLESLQEAYRFVNRVMDLAKDIDIDIATREEQGGGFHYMRVPYSSLPSRVAAMVQQGGSPNKQERDAWRKALDVSMTACQEVYKELGVLLTRDDIRGESAYNDDLPGVIADLTAKGMIEESKGAQCVFLPDFVGKDGERLPLIVQKSDEGYLYATTDLAAMRYRVGTLHANRILYVVDMRQSLHFKMVFATARAAGFVPETVSLEHVGFGTMMGPDGKPFKTRTGGTVKLMDLLNEGVDKARELVDRKNAEDVEKGRTSPLSDEQKQQIAQAVGIGAVKYADLSQNRASDYVFSWDKMLSLDGNTAPYMQYAYARVRSIYRKGGLDASSAGGAIRIGEPAERMLAVKLMQFPEAVATVAAECLPNVLCAYLYDLAGAFTAFYENCPVLKSDEPIRASRLALCDLTARVIRTGLDLLGIQTIEQM